MLHALVTPHDAFQDGVLLLIFLMVCVNNVALALHLRDHKRWRETEEELHRHSGSVHP
jgi:hypothetical protein